MASALQSIACSGGTLLDVLPFTSASASVDQKSMAYVARQIGLFFARSESQQLDVYRCRWQHRCRPARIPESNTFLGRFKSLRDMTGGVAAVACSVKDKMSGILFVATTHLRPQNGHLTFRVPATES
jgi:hypothetical protein